MTHSAANEHADAAKEQVSQVRSLPHALRWLPGTITVLLTLMTLDYLFNLGLLTVVTGLETQFYYAVVALLLPLVYLLWPMLSSGQDKPVPWYDYVLFLLTAIVGGYFVVQAEPILERGWAFAAPESISTVGGAALGWVSTNFGWLFSALAIVVILYMLVVGYGRSGGVRLGSDDEQPEFSTTSWIAMLFSAGIAW